MRSLWTSAYKHREEELKKIAKKFDKKTLEAAQEFFKEKGVNLTLEETAYMLFTFAQKAPLFTKKPRAKAEEVLIYAYQNGRPQLIIEAREPEVFSYVRARKGRFRQIMSLLSKKGRFTISKVKGRNIYTLGYIGGGHFDYHVFDIYQIEALIKVLEDIRKKMKNEKRRSG